MKKILRPYRLLSGALFDPFEPDLTKIDIEDIAYGLAHSNRYKGQTEYPISTAFHTLWVAKQVWRAGGNWATQYAALHHDDTDAFLPDWPSPQKRNPHLKWLLEKEANLQKALDIWNEVPKKCDRKLVKIWDTKAVSESYGERADVRTPEGKTPSYWAARWLEEDKSLREALGLLDRRLRTW